MLEIELSKASLPAAAVHCGRVQCLWWTARDVQRLMPEGAYCSMRHCSVPTTLPTFCRPFFCWHSDCVRKEKTRGVFFTCISTGFIQQHSSSECKQQSWTARISRQSHHPQHDFACPPPHTHTLLRWQDKLHGWEIKAFGVALTQNHSVICCLLLSRRLTFYLWSKMWFYCQTQLVVSRRVLPRWGKMASLRGGDGDCDERVATISFRLKHGGLIWKYKVQ